MRIERRIENPIAIILFFSVFAIAGIGLTIFGITMHRNNIIFMRTAVQTTATITDIQIVRRGSDNYDRRVYVSHVIDGVEYEGLLGHWHSGMRVGQQIAVYYNPDNPRSFRSGSNRYIYLLVALFGTVFFAAGVMPPYMMRRQSMRQKNMIANGKKVMATVYDVMRGNMNTSGHRPNRLNAWIVSNITTDGHNSPSRRTSCILICRYKDEMTGTIHVFKSQNVWVDLPELSKEEPLLVPVYVYSNDYSKYHVAVEELFAESTGGDNSNMVDFTRRGR